MSKKLYLNLPVKDTVKSRDFYTGIGFESKSEFSNPMSEAIVINSDTLLLLVREDFFKESTKRSLADTTVAAETLLAVEVESRKQVDGIVDKANEAGAEEIGEAFEHEGMYTRIFRDVDGHQFNIFAWVE
jgi:predicted lactoylglutathione lyase